MEKSSLNYEKRVGNKRQAKCKYKQRYSKKIQRVLRKEINQQIKTNRRINKEIYGGKEIMGKKEETTDIIHYLYPQLKKWE